MFDEETRRKMNPDNLREGDLLPCVGGPLDGELRPVSLFVGVLPNAGFTVGKYWYSRIGRKWVCKSVAQTAKEEM